MMELSLGVPELPLGAVLGGMMPTVAEHGPQGSKDRR